MQRSSESIAQLTCALAKAQIELVNPEKSLIGTVQQDGPAGVERSFRYASLASGLDIVRKVLGEHEIATVQTTAIDHGAGIVNLTTTLAHASGEWIASDWPVCAVNETANPQRMGAALTYARRYGLFTLVGIAGEDDLDAPARNAPTIPNAEPEQPATRNRVRLNGRGLRHHDAPPRPYQRRTSAFSPSTTPNLEPESSTALCEKLLAEVAGLGSAEDASGWAKSALLARNSLAAPHAASVEDAFQAQLATLVELDAQATQQPQAAAQATPGATPRTARVASPKSRSGAKLTPLKGIDKTVLALPEPRRLRDRDHVRHVAKRPCLICGR